MGSAGVKGRHDLLQSVQRACQILTILAAERHPMPARAISEAMGINVSTCYHLLNTLEDEGFLARDGSKCFRLGHRVSALHDAFREMLSPDPRLLEFLDLLNRRTDETSYLGVWGDDKVVSVAVREGRRGVRVRGLYLGYQEHCYARALGRALLAYREPKFIDSYLMSTEFEQLTPQTCTVAEILEERLDDVRQLGVAIEEEEFTSGVCCAAAPIFDAEERAFAALSVSVPKARFDVDRELIVATVLDVSREATALFASDRLLSEELVGNFAVPARASRPEGQPTARSRAV